MLCANGAVLVMCSFAFIAFTICIVVSAVRGFVHAHGCVCCDVRCVFDLLVNALLWCLMCSVFARVEC